VFGSDALAWLLSDNQDIDMNKYWFLTNATALQAQDFFYIANEIMWDGRFKGRMQGPLTDKKFDEKEREITNFRLRKQIEWQGKWSTPLEYEEAVREYGSEQRASNALRRRVLFYQLFYQDIKEGGRHPLFSVFDTNTWLASALDNNSNSEEMRDYILARLNDPQRYEEDVNRIKNNWKNAERSPYLGAIAKKVSEYFDIIFSEGKPYEIAGLVINRYTHERVHHDIATSLSALWVTLIGGGGGEGDAKTLHPGDEYVWDSQFMFTLSKATEEKLKDVFLWEIDDLRGLMPNSQESDLNKYKSVDGLFGVYSNLDALKAIAKSLSVNTPSHRYIEFSLTK
jgi:hypothetical protein